MSDVLWGERPEGSRGPRAGLTLRGIATAGVAIADAEGLGAVSMQHLATQLGVTKMALYRYLPGKRELVALILEEALGPAPDLAGQGWREGLRTWSHALLAAHLRHPWTLEAVLQGRPVGPHELGWMESMTALLTQAGLTGPEQLGLLAALTGQVRVIAQQSPAPSSADEGFARSVAAALSSRGDHFPALTAALADVVHGRGVDHREATPLTFGLELMLEGLGNIIRERARAV